MKKIFLLVIVLFSSFAVGQPQKTKKDSLFHSIGALVGARFELEIRGAQYEFLKKLSEVTADGVLSRTNLFDVEAKKREMEDIKNEAKEELSFYGIKEDFNFLWAEEDADILDAIDNLNNSASVFSLYFPEESIKHLQKALIIQCHKPVKVNFYAHLSSFAFYGFCLLVFSFLFFIKGNKALFWLLFVLGCILLFVTLFNFLLFI